MHAANAYSDDHGRTWKLGVSPATGLDENKAVELATGDVMQNYRAYPKTITHRLVAVSRDGGVTYSTPTEDANLPDPRNNASIIRAFPDANPASPEARMLLFSNTPDPAQRRDLTVRLSCDSGRSWPVAKRVEDGDSMYSTLARLSDGSYGIFFEAKGSLQFARFNLAWLGGRCR